MTEEELRALPWYGGNKIPDSYLAKFIPKTNDDDLPWELRVFIDQLGTTSIEQRQAEAYKASYEQQ